MKNKVSILIIFFMILSFTGCGTKDMEKYIYETDTDKFSVEIPSDWTCKSMHGPDGSNYDFPEEGMEIYIEGSEENRIDVFRMHGKITWHYEYETKKISIGKDLEGLLVEEEIEKQGESYIHVSVIIGDYHCISMEIEKEVYEGNRKDIENMIQSFELIK